MITNILIIIVIKCVSYIVFMASPFGILFSEEEYSQGGSCYSMIILFVTSFLAVVIIEYLKMIMAF